MTSSQEQTLAGLAVTATAIRNEIADDFGSLSESQLNWKPDTNRWSIAQCLDHLLTANTAYFPIFEKILAGENEHTVWQRLPWLPGVWGRMLIKAVSPESARKLKAPGIFQPSSSRIARDIIGRFLDQQDQVIGYLRAMEGLDAERVILSSPVSRFITYSLLDAYKIIITHERRHIQQAGRVAEMSAFPK